MAKKISNLEGIRQALKHFGNEAKPVQIRPWLKEKLSIDMTSDQISKAKSAVLGAARTAAAKKAAPNPQTAEAAAQKTQPKKEAATPSHRRGSAVPLEDILYLQQLVQRVDPVALKTLIDAFSK